MLEALTRRLLLKFRLHNVPEGHALDPHSLEYLYLVQQRKRLSLSATTGRIRPRNLILLPVILPLAFVKVIDLWISNQIVRSLINEHDLMRLINKSKDCVG